MRVSLLSLLCGLDFPWWGGLSEINACVFEEFAVLVDLAVQRGVERDDIAVVQVELIRDHLWGVIVPSGIYSWYCMHIWCSQVCIRRHQNQKKGKMMILKAAITA